MRSPDLQLRTELPLLSLARPKPRIVVSCGQHRELLLPSSSLDPSPCLPHSSQEGKAAKTRAVGSTHYANILDALPSSRLRQGFLCIYFLFAFEVPVACDTGSLATSFPVRAMGSAAPSTLLSALLSTLLPDTAGTLHTGFITSSLEGPYLLPPALSHSP